MDYWQLSERVKLVQSKLDIYEIVSKYVTLRKDGELYFGRCPFHEDEGESLAVNPIEGKFYCVGCHAGGSTLNFVARVQNISLIEAFELQAKNFDLKFDSTKIDFDAERIERRNRELAEINDYARDFYHEILMNAAEGETCRKYLESRGIKKREIEKFQLGFTPNNAKDLTAFLDGYDFKLYEIIQSGLVESTDEGFNDKFRECVTIPILNRFGNTTALIGQILDYDKKVFYESEGITSKYVYPKESSVFNQRQLIFGLNAARSEIVKSNSVIVVEDCLDAVYLSSAGIENVIAVFAKTLNVEQAEILSVLAKRIIFCLKTGDAIEIEEDVLTSIARQGGKIFIAALSESIYEFVSKNGTEIFRQSLDGSLPFDDYEFSKRGYDESKATQKIVPVNQNSQTIFESLSMRRAGEAVLKIACRDAGIFKYAMAVLPKEFFSESQQALIEYLTICLDENSRPNKEGAAIFFDGKVDENILNMLENSQSPTDSERLAFEDGMDFLLKKLRRVNYSQIKIKAVTEKNSGDKEMKKLLELTKQNTK